MQIGSGLTRYRSAPSSYFGTLLNNTNGDARFGADDFAQLFNPKASSPETQRIFARFMNSASDNAQDNCSTNIPEAQSQSQLDSKLLPPINHEPKAKQLRRQRSNDYSSVGYPSHNSIAANSVHSIPKAKKMKMEEQGGGGFSLLRHSSSPAGLFASVHIESATLKSPVDFTSRNYSSGMMPPIPNIASKDIGENSVGDRQFDGFAANPWDDDSAILSDDFLKGLADDEERTFSRTSSSDDQYNKQNHKDGKQSTTRLSHHLSLPKSPAVEKLLQDSVHFKARAKRGFATHPRSIAERVRRTKISERVRKLQDLVPNMDKQTNTADMLDLAFDYIKDLQRQVKILEDNRDKCCC